MPRIRWFRALLILLLVSQALAIADELVLWTGMVTEMRAVASGAAFGLIVFAIIMRGGLTIRFVLQPAGDAEAQSAADAALKRAANGSSSKLSVFVYASDSLAAFTSCDGSGYCIFISHRMADEMSSDGLAAVLAHECGHAEAQHPRRQAFLLGLIGAVKMAFGIPLPAAIAIILAYFVMLREWEYVADRAAAGKVGNDTVIEAFDEYRYLTGDSCKHGFWSDLLSTHPCLHDREAAIREFSSGAAESSLHAYLPYLPPRQRGRKNKRRP